VAILKDYLVLKQKKEKKTIALVGSSGAVRIKSLQILIPRFHTQAAERYW
jgi:hypothetical protein